MGRITVTFDNDVFTKLSNDADSLEITTAAYVRRMVDLGLRVSEAEKKSDKPEDIIDSIEKRIVDAIGKLDHLGELELLWKNNLTWLMETRQITRYIVETMSKEKGVDYEKLLRTLKEKSSDYVSGLMQKDIE